MGDSIVFGGDPTHDAEASNEVHSLDLQPIVGKIGVLLPKLRILVPREIQVPNLRSGHFGRRSNDGHAGGAQGITASLRLCNEQTGSGILPQVLSVHGHAADEEHWATALVGRVGHQRAEGKSAEFSGMRGQAADTTKRYKRSRALSERRLGTLWDGWSRAGVLLVGHQSMVTKADDVGIEA